jgi:hypothetical protein
MIMMLSSGGVPECLHADRVGGLMWSDDGAVRDGTLSRRDGTLPGGMARCPGEMASFPGASPPLSAIADSTRVQVTPKTTSLPRDLIIAG